MFKVLLIGDSIRLGYQETVRSELAGFAVVLAPEENCENSRKVLAHLPHWIGDLHPDLIHMNCGLHDLKKEFEASALTVPLQEYEENLQAIFALARPRSGHVVWATTTPVNQVNHHAHKPFDRFEADVAAYNAAACAIARASGLEIDDLYAVITAAGRDRLLLADGVHYDTKGYALLGRSVAEMIRGCLGTA